jgi:chromosome segregation ATPase
VLAGIDLSQVDFNSIAIVAGFVMAVMFLPRFFRVSASRAREQEMQRTIEAYKGRVEALEEVEKGHAEEIRSLRDQIHECHLTAAKWEERYHEQSKYTAKDSLDLVVKELTATRQAMVTGFEAQSELILKTLELQSKTLDRVGGDPRIIKP